MSFKPGDNTFSDLLNNRKVVAFIAIAVLALIAVCVFGFTLLRSLSDKETPDEATATPFTSTPVALPPNEEPLIVGISDSSTITVALDMPVSLRLGDVSYTIEPQVIPPSGEWLPANAGEGTAVWVYGSIINYVIGLPDSADNRLAMEQLVPGTQMVLTTRGGTSHTFTFNSRDTVPTSNRDVFAQNSPGLTLILLGADGQDRLVVKGRYVVADTENAGPSNVVELGESAQFDEIQVTVNGATTLQDRPEAPANMAFFLVDFELKNLGLTALDTTSLDLLLVDELGNQFVLDAQASQLGNYPPLSGFLNANESVQATAGYQIPVDLSSTSLRWLVAHGSGGRVQVNIPFAGSTSAGQLTNITLIRADVSSDLTSLILAGQITNLGEEQAVVTEGDVSLQTDDGVKYLLLSTNPPFPWTVPPGETRPYTVTFQRPQLATAVFTVLNQGFALTGLR